jgi:hypothetical protein
VNPIAAFCSSDEEAEDKDALLFLPIAPDVCCKYAFCMNATELCMMMGDLYYFKINYTG